MSYKVVNPLDLEKPFGQKKEPRGKLFSDYHSTHQNYHE